MHRLSAAIPAAFALMCLASPVPAAEDKTWDREFTVSRQPTIRIESDDAEVTVRSWKGSRVKVHVEQRGETEGILFGHRRPRVDITQKGQEVIVVARMEGSTGGIVIRQAHLDVEVWLPRESNLIVETEDGPLRVEDVAGAIDLDTEDGSVTARGLSGIIHVHSEDGKIELDDVDGSLQLETEDATSVVRGRFDRMDVESEDGGFRIEALAGSKLQDEWSLRTQDGGIRLSIPRKLAATIDARTQDGSLSVDLPVQLQGRVRHNQLVGSLNGGGPTLRLRSSDGSIHVTPID